MFKTYLNKNLVVNAEFLIVHQNVAPLSKPPPNVDAKK